MGNAGLQMQYLKALGIWSDLPYDRIRDEFRAYYPADCAKVATQ